MRIYNKKNMQIIEIYAKFKECGSVTTDTRTLKGGEMFFALKGENFDGNEYAMKALEAGARYAVVNVDSAAAASGDPRLVVVEDTLKTLPYEPGKYAVVLEGMEPDGKTYDVDIVFIRNGMEGETVTASVM